MATSSNPWLRLWVDMPNDPKWRTIARVSKQPISTVLAVYLHILVSASNANERGRTQDVCSEDVASALDVDTEQVDAIMAAMQGRVLDGDVVSGWAKRQPGREDGSAERAKAYREAKKQPKTPIQTAITEQQTQPNATERKQPLEKRREEEIREDIKTHTVAISGGNAPEPAAGVSMQAAVCMVIKAEGIASVNPQHPELLALIGQGVEVGQFAQAAKLARAKNKGFTYLLGVVKGQMADAKTIADGVVFSPASGANQRAQAESFQERDARIGRERWEQSTGEVHPDNQSRVAGDVVNAATKFVEISQ